MYRSIFVIPAYKIITCVHMYIMICIALAIVVAIAIDIAITCRQDSKVSVVEIRPAALPDYVLTDSLSIDMLVCMPIQLYTYLHVCTLCVDFCMHEQLCFLYGI